MDIKHSRRILVLGKREAGALDILKNLTGSAPSPDVDGSIAGLTHEWHAQTAYYTANVPIWIDEVPDFESWRTEFLKEEAKEVVEAIGAWIYCFRPDAAGHLGADAEAAMKSIQEVAEAHSNGYAGDVTMLAVAMGKVATTQGREEQEDICMDYGFEYIDYTASGTNTFGEKQGLDRLREALEANEWSAAMDEDDLEDLGFGVGDDIGDFGYEEAEMTAELFGMKAALNNTDDNDDDDLPPEQQAGQVEDLNKMMGKLLAIKEQSADMPEEQRKRMAAKAVKELLNENPNI